MSGDCDYVDKFQCISIKEEYFDDEMSEERVYSIKRIAPDRFNDILKTPTTINGKSCLREIISSQLKKPESADIMLQIGDEMFKIPMAVLQSYSKFFQSHSIHEKVVNLSPDNITPNVFHMIYAWMLSSSKLVGREDLISLLMGAQVNLTKLHIACINYI
jgi:intracellular septation protein A